MPMQVELVSPERILWSGQADMVRARTVGGGDIAFLPGHAPFVAALDTWTVEILLTEGGRLTAAVHGGFVQVSGESVKILSDLAEMTDQIDVERARLAKEQAEAAVRTGDDVEAEAALRRAHVRLVAAGAEAA
jgi:F-type H+-transporting ATPase subunit epsilon